ncbi:hypothetical protein IGI43_001039 [Enterococcus sp. AZ126]
MIIENSTLLYKMTTFDYSFGYVYLYVICLRVVGNKKMEMKQ